MTERIYRIGSRRPTPRDEDALTRLAPEWQAMYEEKALEMIGKLR